MEVGVEIALAISYRRPFGVRIGNPALGSNLPRWRVKQNDLHGTPVYMRFSYFDRLSPKDKRIYLRSDAIREVKVPDAGALLLLTDALRVELEAARRIRTTKAANALILALCKQLSAPKVRVRIREVRPSWDGGELHGLYTFAEEASDIPEIEVWMRTVAHGRVVKFRTFLRTLLHEACHHLDATIYQMKESFHTHGFFARESSLLKQLAPLPQAKTGKPAALKRQPAQLSLFEAGARRKGTRGE
jgi:hypothetical protein